MRREAVLDAAHRVFELKGLDGASIRLIAREAGCTTGAIYPHFSGKEEIYAEVLSRSLDGYTRALLSCADAADVPAQRLEKLLRTHFDYYEARPSHLSLALYLFNGLKPQGLTRELDARLNAQLRMIHLLFVEGVRAFSRGPADQADIEVGLHLSMLFGLLTLHHTRRTRLFRVEARSLLSEYIARALDQTAS